MGSTVDISQSAINSSRGTRIIARLLNVNLKNAYSSNQSVITFTGAYQSRSRIGTSNEYYVSNAFNTFATIQEYIDYVKSVYEAAGFTVEQTDTLELTLDSPTDKNYSGFTPIVESRTNGFGPYTNALSDDPDFSGGGATVPQEHTINWTDGNSNENTVPRYIAITPKQGVWNGTNAPGIVSTQTLTCTGIGVDGDTIEFTSNPNYFGVALYTKVPGDDDTTKVAAGWVAAINAAAGSTIASNVGAIVTINYGVGSANNGVQLVINNTGAMTYTGGADSAGGANATTASIIITKDGDTITINSQSLISALPSLVVGETILIGVPTGSTIASLIKAIGDWVLSVLEGTGDDFFVDINIYGDLI